MPTPHERIGIALDLLTQGLFPYFEQEMQSVFPDDWQSAARAGSRSERHVPLADLPPMRWDAHAILTVMWDQWNAVFRQRLGLTERSLVGEIREFRNRWAHQSPLTDDDAYRVLDSVQRLLAAVGAEEAARKAEDHKWAVLRELMGRNAIAEGAPSRLRGDCLIDVTLYLACAVALCAAMFTMIGDGQPSSRWIFVAFVAFSFAYFIARRVMQDLPAFASTARGTAGKITATEGMPAILSAADAGQVLARAPSRGSPAHANEPACRCKPSVHH